MSPDTARTIIHETRDSTLRIAILLCEEFAATGASAAELVKALRDLRAMMKAAQDQGARAP